MKAVVFKNYGSPDVLHLTRVEKPIPKDDLILVKVHAAAVNAADWHILRASPFFARFFTGLFLPKFQVLGADIAGTVESTGKNIKKFKPGDAVFGDIFSCGLGGFAEYAIATETDCCYETARGIL